ncbi:MAG: FAD-binding oxidoreductase [Leptolyngbya sp. SIOISBB]|nr:FAD-binding oxidoreductase [Leptolyngbya sp. SIOISBB]
MGSIAQTIESILGASQVIPWASLVEPLTSTVQGAIAADTPPTCIAYPQTPDELAAVVACAHQNQWHLLPCGHGSKLTWGSPVTGVDLVVSTQHLNQVIEHAEGDLTVTAQAGVSFAELQSQLLQTRQFLAIDPAYPDQATLGGIVATRDTGGLRQRFGGIRDMLIGVSFVRYDGQLAKAGGRVVKNVAGYDLMKLMTGSFGTLGILTQLTWRTYPLQETSQTVVLTGNAEAIQQATATVLQSSLTPVAMDVLSAELTADGASDTLALALQFQSIEAGVTEQGERLQAIAQPHNLACQILTAQADTAFWQTLNRTLFPPQEPAIALCKLGILPAQAVDLLTFLDQTLTPDTWQARIHAGSGIGTLRLSATGNSVQQVQQVRSRCQAANGYLTLLEAPPEWKAQLDPWGIDQATQLLMTRLREQFDPHSQLSPGRMG